MNIPVSGLSQILNLYSNALRKWWRSSWIIISKVMFWMNLCNLHSKNIIVWRHNQNSVILLLLNLSATFDTIDHEILLSRLSSRYGIIGEAHKWFESYLKERTHKVHVSSGQSTIRTLRSGVPQGSTMGPMLFSLYIAPIGDLLRSLDIDFHLYADDTQLYVTFNQIIQTT